MLARFDLFVALFFALSAFLLWRRPPRSWPVYFARRAIRILPAYFVCVLAVLALFPPAFGATWPQVLAQLTFTQLYVPGALLPGLTHLWALAVEVAFYLLFPLFFAASRRPALLLAALCALGFSWPWLPFVVAHPEPVNLQIWPPAYLPWFAVGIVLAELESRAFARGGFPTWVRAITRPAALWWVAALGVAWVAGQPWFGPAGLVHPTPWQFNLRILAGCLFAACFLLPAIVAGSAGGVLASRPVRFVGRISYSLFLWHVAVLGVAPAVVGIGLFSGHFLAVGVFTFAVSVPVAWASYLFIEHAAATAASTTQWVRGLSPA